MSCGPISIYHDKELSIDRQFKTETSPVAAVGQRRDDETRRVPEILVPVSNGGCDHSQCDLPILPKIPKLGNPLEIIQRRNSVLSQFTHYVTCCMKERPEVLSKRYDSISNDLNMFKMNYTMNINHNQSSECHPRTTG